MAQMRLFGLEHVDNTIWPQRLLRIKDMTSYECQMQGSDAFYRKNDKNPEYAIMSYTWGRYRADGQYGTEEKRDAEAITVKGIPWQIPKIDPAEGFSSDKFRNVLRTVAGNYKYVWVDVACIDQRPHQDSSDQVGCQASIFSKASAAFIWLHRQSLKNDTPISERIAALAKSIQMDSADYSSMTSKEQEASIGPRQTAEGHIRRLFCDPWFTSLWTLQESFLRRDATILSRTGETTTLLWNGSRVILTLEVLLDICHSYLAIPSGLRNAHIATAIQAAGLASIRAQNPLVLLRAARHRTSLKNEDRIIGIQQIFGVKVKVDDRKSSNDAERALSVAINQQCPPLAQLFLHTYDASERIPYWKVFLGTYIPSDGDPSQPIAKAPGYPARRRRGAGLEDTLFIPEDFFNAQEVSSALRAKLSDSQTGYLLWEGSSFWAESLWDSWQQYECDRMPPGLERGEFIPHSFSTGDESEQIYLNSFDCSVYLDSGCPSYVFSRAVNVVPVQGCEYTKPLPTIYEICAKLPSQVKVLILGKIQARPIEPSPRAWVGLLVIRDQDDAWTRVGFCTWKMDMVWNALTPESCLLL